MRLKENELQSRRPVHAAPALPGQIARSAVMTGVERKYTLMEMVFSDVGGLAQCPVTLVRGRTIPSSS